MRRPAATKPAHLDDRPPGLQAVSPGIFRSVPVPPGRSRFLPVPPGRSPSGPARSGVIRPGPRRRPPARPPTTPRPGWRPGGTSGSRPAAPRSGSGRPRTPGPARRPRSPPARPGAGRSTCPAAHPRAWQAARRASWTGAGRSNSRITRPPSHSHRRTGSQDRVPRRPSAGRAAGVGSGSGRPGGAAAGRAAGSSSRGYSGSGGPGSAVGVPSGRSAGVLLMGEDPGRVRRRGGEAAGVARGGPSRTIEIGRRKVSPNRENR